MRLTKVEVLRESIKIIIGALSEKKVPITQVGARAFVEWHPVTGRPKRINIPYVPDNASDRLIKAVQGFVDHECAHVLFTDFECVKLAIKSGAGMVGNILEDTYIERKMKALYAGSRHNLIEVWGFLAEEMLKEPLDAAIAEGHRAKIVATGLPIAIHAWAGNEAAIEFMDTRWDAFKDIQKIIGEDIIDKIPEVKSSYDGLLLAVAMKNRLMEWKEKEEREEKERRKKEREEKEREEKEKGDGDGEPGDGDGGDPDMDDVLDDDREEVDGDSPIDDDDGEEADGDDDCESDGGGEDDDADDFDEDDDDFRPADPRAEEDETPEDDSEVEGGSEDDEEEDDPEFESTFDPETHNPEDDEDGDMDAPPIKDGEDESGDAETDGGGDEESDEPEKSSESGKKKDEDDDKERGHTSPEGPPEPSEEEEEEEEEEEDISDFESEAEEILEAMEDMEDMEGVSNELIAEEMDKALESTEYWPLTKDGDLIERYTPKKVNVGYVRQRQEEIQKHIGHITKRLQRMIQARSYDRRIPGFRSGKLDGAALHRVPTGDDRVFRRTIRMTTKDVDVQLVVDLSGSMVGDKVELATEVAYAIAMPLDRLGINNQVVGFTTTDMNRITHHTKVLEERYHGRPPSRYEPIYMPILKDWDQRFTPDRQIATIMSAKDVRLFNNIDGESIEYAGRMLWAQPGSRKLMIVLSDGNPSAHGNREEQAVHLRRVVRRLEASGTEIFGVGIMDESVKRYYKNAVVIHQLDEVLSTVMGVLEAMLMRGAL